MTNDPWKHRSKNMSCATCMWFVEKMRNEVEIARATEDGRHLELALGRCRRHAPTMNGYPAVFKNDWCGDHKLDENKLGGMANGKD